MDYMLYDHYSEKVLIICETLEEVLEYMEFDKERRKATGKCFDYYIYEMLQ